MAATRIRWDRLGRWALIAVFAFVLYLYIGPARTWVTTYSEAKRKRAEVAQLQAENEQLRARRAELEQRGAPGIYNVCDDDPAPVREWLPALAEAVGARPPRHMPGILGRLLLGPAGYAMMTDIRGASNAKAKRELGWTPAYQSSRQGFAAL